MGTRGARRQRFLFTRLRLQTAATSTQMNRERRVKTLAGKLNVQNVLQSIWNRHNTIIAYILIFYEFMILSLHIYTI